ncbi:hypothetical protein ACOSQ2_021137 [Xanthoceras sorbifolium]
MDNMSSAQKHFIEEHKGLRVFRGVVELWRVASRNSGGTVKGKGVDSSKLQRQWNRAGQKGSAEVLARKRRVAGWARSEE